MFTIGDHIEFERTKNNETKVVSGEVVPMPKNQQHLINHVCIRLSDGSYRTYLRDQMTGIQVAIIV